MDTYDGQVNDYLRAVEQALDGVPASRRDDLLADLSEHIAAKLADTKGAGTSGAALSESEVRSVLDLLGDPEDVAAELAAGEHDVDPQTPDARISAGRLPDHAHLGEDAAPIEINPGRKLGAIIWVLITIATVSLLCIGVVLAGVLLFLTRK